MDALVERRKFFSSYFRSHPRQLRAALSTRFFFRFFTTTFHRGIRRETRVTRPSIATTGGESLLISKRARTRAVNRRRSVARRELEKAFPFRVVAPCHRTAPPRSRRHDSRTRSAGVVLWCPADPDRPPSNGRNGTTWRTLRAKRDDLTVPSGRRVRPARAGDFFPSGRTTAIRKKKNCRGFSWIRNRRPDYGNPDDLLTSRRIRNARSVRKDSRPTNFGTAIQIRCVERRRDTGKGEKQFTSSERKMNIRAQNIAPVPV